MNGWKLQGLTVHTFHLHLHMCTWVMQSLTCAHWLLSYYLISGVLWHMHTLMHVFRLEWTNSAQMSVCLLYIMQNTGLFTSRGCLSFLLPLFPPYLSVCLSVCLFLSLCLSVEVEDWSYPSLTPPSSLPLCLSCSSTEKWVMSKEKSDREKLKWDPTSF